MTSLIDRSSGASETQFYGVREHRSRPPRVSVVIPTYQRRLQVRQAVQSVMAQSYRDWELIVIDDGSTDGTRDELARLAPSARYRWQPNRGVAAARNAALELARGSIVAFLDSDDRWLPDHLATLVAGLEQHPEAVLAFSLSRSSAGPRRSSRAAQMTDPLPRLLIGNYVGTFSAVAVRRASVAAVGGFDERLRIAVDADLWLRLAMRGGRFLSVARRTVVVRTRRDSLFKSRRRAGAYLDALETSTAGLIAELEHSPDAPTELLAQTRGRARFLDALRSLNRGDDGAVRIALADGCRLLPGLARAPDSVVTHLRFNLPADSRDSERVDQLVAVARLWPDRRSAAVSALWAEALLVAIARGRLLRAAEILRQAGTATGVVLRLPGLLQRRARRMLRGLVLRLARQG